MKSAVSFAMLTAVLVGALAVANWMPSVIDREVLRKYTSVESVQRDLHMDKIYMPSYLPEYLRLNSIPVEIYAQKKPFSMVLLHFQSWDSKDIGLIVHQISAKADYHPESEIKLGSVIRRSKVSIKGRDGLLITAECEKRGTCNQVSWTEGNYLLKVISKGSARDVIRIAASMIPDA